MVTPSDVAAIIRRAREASAKVRVVFRGQRYVMVIDGFIRAEDRDSSRVEWSRAFGSLTPAQLLSAMPIEVIEVQMPDKTLTFTSLKEFLKWAL